MHARIILAFRFFTLAVVSLASVSVFAAERPNIMIVFTDDQGYGDLGCFGSKTIKTPRIDQMAREGTKFTSFYADVVCGASRSALLTGRYPIRSGGWSVPTTEVTIAEVLKDAGYATCCIGKWDVSDRKAIIDRMPIAQGFDYYFGALGANDDGLVKFHENNEPAGETRDMGSLTKLYTDKGIEFIEQHKDEPFLLYLAHTMVHSVVGASEDFRGKSDGGLYGDAVEEIDFHTGRVIDTLQELGLDKNTLVIFTTDNGPWNNMTERLRKRHNGEIAWGSSGPLREGKGSTYEGGLRVPCVVWWPGKVPADRTSDAIFSTLDFLPTFANLAGGKVPDDRIVDGKDQMELILGRSETGARDEFHYFSMGALHGMRSGKWKLLRAKRLYPRGYVKDKGPGKIELFDLEADIGEQKNLAAEHPEIVAELRKKMKADWPEQFGKEPPPKVDRF